MTDKVLAPIPKMHFDDPETGGPAAGFQLFVYEAGTVSKATTWTDANGGTPNTNPIILDSLGNCDVWWDPTLPVPIEPLPPGPPGPQGVEGPTGATGATGPAGAPETYQPTYRGVFATGNITAADGFLFCGNSSAITLTMPASAAISPRSYFFTIKVSALAGDNVTIAVQSGDYMNNNLNGTKILIPGDSAIFVSDAAGGFQSIP